MLVYKIVVLVLNWILGFDENLVEYYGLARGWLVGISVKVDFVRGVFTL